jgi:hypothetical protein
MHLSSLETLNAHQWATAPWRDWSCQLAGRPLSARLIIAAMSVVMMSVGMGCLAWLSWLDLMAVSWWEWFACVAMAGAGLGLWSYEQKRDETSWKALLEQLEKLPAALRQTLAHSPEVPPLVREGLLKALPRMESQGSALRWKGPTERELAQHRPDALTTWQGVLLALSFGVLWAGVDGVFNPEVSGGWCFLMLLSGLVVWVVPLALELHRRERHRAASWERYWRVQAWSMQVGRHVWQRLPDGEARDRLATHLSRHYPGWSLDFAAPN